MNFRFFLLRGKTGQAPYKLIFLRRKPSADQRQQSVTFSK